MLRCTYPAAMGALGCLVGVVAAASLSAAAHAQARFPGDVAALKAEVYKRAQINQYPVIGYDPAQIKAGLDKLTAKDPEQWAGIWTEIGDRTFQKAKSEEATDKAAAAHDYNVAYHWYALARFPSPESPRKAAALKKEYAAFAAFDRLTPNPVSVETFQTPEGPITVYLRLPQTKGPWPLLVRISGLDGYKEGDAMGDSVAYTHNGVAFLSLDAPGTSQSVHAGPQAIGALLSVIDKVRARPDIDKTKVVAYGSSWGAYWTTALAYAGPDRFAAVVSQAPGTDKSFNTGLDGTLTTKEYLFDMQTALELAFNVKGLPALRQAMAPMSLRTMGMLGKPTPPMLLVDGAHDTLFPIEEMYLLQRQGSAKYVWVNPTGIHNGRDLGGYWDTVRIQSEVIRPFLLRYMQVTNWTAAPPVGR